VYFLLDSVSILKYTNGIFNSPHALYGSFFTAGNTVEYVSNDLGRSWFELASGPGAGVHGSAVYGNGTYMLGWSPPYGVPVQTSPDGFTWTPPVNQADATSLAFGNGSFVAVSYDCKHAAVSRNGGIDWTTYSIPTTGISQIYGNSATYGTPGGQGLFVVVTPSTQVAASPDGVNWEVYTAPNSIWTSVVYGNGIFVAVGTESPYAMTSPDGINWTAQTAPSRSWLAITYGNGLFVAVGSYGTSEIMTSPDGVNWTIQTSPFGYFYSVTYLNGMFAAASTGGSYNNGTVITSSDGINWTQNSTVLNFNGDIVFTSGLYTLPYLGTIQNLHAVGSTIYASANTASQTSIIQIDTTKDLSTPAAYQYYTSGEDAPITFAGPVPTIFANGPRYLYIFTDDPSQTTSPTNAVRYDPYPVNPTLQASIIADFKILPPGVPKPTWAEIKYIQNQQVTAESFADLQILGPVKELIITGTPSASNVYQYSNLDGAVSLTITGNEEIITPDVGTVTGLGVMAPFQTHTVLPVRNLSVIPFEIDPESLEPNGTINFSRLQYQNLSNGASVWATSYNILKIESGVGGLKFNSPY